MTGPSRVGNIVGIVAILEPFAEIRDKLRRHPAVAVRHGVAPERDPDQHLALAVRADPPKRLVLPFDHDRADAVKVVRGYRKISNPGLGHRCDRAPGVTRHIANHCRVHRRAALPAQLGRVAEETHQLLRPAESGQFVQVHPVEGDLAVSDGVDEFLALL